MTLAPATTPDGPQTVALIPGDGIGVDVIAAAREVLESVLVDRPGAVEFTEFPWGSEYYLETGAMMAPDALEQLRGFDAILFGAVGWPTVADDETLWGLRLAIVQGLDQYVAYRPTRRYPSVPGPLRSDKPFDFVIVRENSEGEYAGAGGRTHRGQPSEVAVEASVFTRSGIDRVVEYAFALARTRRGHLVNVTKSNAQRHSMALWDEVVREHAERNHDIEVEHLLVDAAAAKLVLAPERFDVLVASNLFGDILSDLGAALMGSLGLASSANLDPLRRSPSMFEPVHGSAPDIAGQGIANPIGAIESAALMLDHIGLAVEAQRIRVAVDDALRAGCATPDLAGEATTADVAGAIIAALGSVSTPR
jgi:tartrate dehydrogenase/decarboxylase/D-malate dehydrogenase